MATPEHHPTAPAASGEMRPEPRLLFYYFLFSLVLGPLFLVLFLPLVFRYRTLCYRFDEEGISMRWGALFRREVHLTYARIQDLHLTSNLVERWLGLGRVEVQTASGSAKAEMVIEGLLDFEAVRDRIYRRMRGVEDGGDEPAARTDERTETAAPSAAPTASGLDDRSTRELALVLRQVAAELEALRHLLEARRS